MITQKTSRVNMSKLASFGALVLSVIPGIAFAGDPKVENTTINLLAPLGPSNTITIGPGFTTWFDYFNNSAGWLYNVAIGICVLWILVGGLFVMVSGDNPQLAEKGKGFMIGSLTGLVMLILAPTILRTLNGLFFT